MTMEEAICILKNSAWLGTHEERVETEQAIDMAIEALSADPVQGEWIPNHDGSWNCSECGLRVLVYAKGNFCPNCGADMYKGGEEE